MAFRKGQNNSSEENKASKKYKKNKSKATASATTTTTKTTKTTTKTQKQQQQQPNHHGNKQVVNKKGRKQTKQQQQHQQQQQQSCQQERRHSGSTASCTDYDSHSESSSLSSSSSSSPTFSNKKTYPRKRNSRGRTNVNVVNDVDESLYVALDCEMVGVGVDGQDSILARVVIVDWNHNVLLDQYVQPSQPVTDYRTFVSGITPADFQRPDVVDLQTCQQRVLNILNNNNNNNNDQRIVIGHALKNDFKALNIPQHPWQKIRDTAKYPPFMKERPCQQQQQQDNTNTNNSTNTATTTLLLPRKLKELCHEKLSWEIQQPGKPHSPYQDAIAALELYKYAHVKWEKAMDYKIQKTAKIMSLQQQQQQQQQQNQKLPQPQQQQEKCQPITIAT